MGKKNSIIVVGMFERERNVFGLGADRTIIGLLDDGTVIKGKAAEGTLEYGLTYRFSGYWHTHQKYGTQFVFNEFAKATPNGERGTVKYLARATGIGPKRAQGIWDAYGPESLNILRDDPDRVSREVPGINIETATRASELFKKQTMFEEIDIALMDLLANRGFPNGINEKIRNKGGARCIEIIKENPYWLMQFPRVGFSTADKLYLDLGLDPSAMIRQTMCLWYSIASNVDGHTWFEFDFCDQALAKGISSANVDTVGALKNAIQMGLIVVHKHNGRNYVATKAAAINEDSVAYRINSMVQGDAKKHGSDWDSDTWYSESRWPHPDSINIDDHQREEYIKATKNGRSRLAVMAGRPGCGKTHVASEIIKAYGSENGYGGVLVDALAGLAAKRITQFMHERDIPVTGMTIHRALGIASISDDGEFGFAHNATNPLPHRLIVTDECSMIATGLYSSHLEAIGRNSLVLMIGDPNQLAPIGHGAPLRDIIASKTVPCGELKKIRRNSGAIVRACSEILDTGRFSCGRKFDLESEQKENLACVGNGDPENQRQALVGFFNSVRGIGSGYDPVWDSQVMTPCNEGSPIARVELNKFLQDHFNQDGESISGSPFRVGDKVICTKNGKLPPCEFDAKFDITDEQWEESSAQVDERDNKIAVSNGEFGLVLDVKPNLTVVRLLEPFRVVKIPRGKGKDDDDTGCQWELGYVVTGHKAQGNQWPWAVFMIDEAGKAKFTCSREMVYTVMSRGQVATLLIGNQSTAVGFCRKTNTWNRRTLLAEKLRGETGYTLIPNDSVEDGNEEE